MGSRRLDRWVHGRVAGMASVTIADLPDAVLDDIFSRLDVLAVCNAILVCQTFLKRTRMCPSIDLFDAVCSLRGWRRDPGLDVCECRHMAAGSAP